MLWAIPEVEILECGFLEFREMSQKVRKQVESLELWDKGSLGSKPLIPSISSYIPKAEVQGNWCTDSSFPWVDFCCVVGSGQAQTN